MSVESKTYEDGVRDGQINAIEKMLSDHKGRLDNHSMRLRILERVVWGMLGAIALLEILPKIAPFMKAMS